MRVLFLTKYVFYRKWSAGQTCICHLGWCSSYFQLESSSVVLNLFRALAHLEEPQILVAQFLAVANLFCVPWPTLMSRRFSCPTLITSEMWWWQSCWDYRQNAWQRRWSPKKKVICLPSAEDGQCAVGIGVNLQKKIRSLRLQFMGAGPYGGSYAPLLLNLIRLANPSLKYPNVCGPPVENQWSSWSYWCFVAESTFKANPASKLSSIKTLFQFLSPLISNAPAPAPTSLPYVNCLQN